MDAMMLAQIWYPSHLLVKSLNTELLQEMATLPRHTFDEAIDCAANRYVKSHRPIA